MQQVQKAIGPPPKRCPLRPRLKRDYIVAETPRAIPLFRLRSTRKGDSTAPHLSMAQGYIRSAHLYIYTFHICIYKYVYMCTHVYIHARSSLSLYVFTSVSMFIYKHIHKYISICIHIHVYIWSQLLDSLRPYGARPPGPKRCGNPVVQSRGCYSNVPIKATQSMLGTPIRPQ